MAAVAGMAAVAATAAVLVPASPAQASANGSGWSSAWTYYTNTSFSYSATLPGGLVGGGGVDYNGTRSSLYAYVQDNSYDGVCVRGFAFSSTRVLFDGTVCDGQPVKYFYPPAFSSYFYYAIFRVRPDGSGINSHATVVPDSSSDPGLRVAGTGVNWRYYAGFNFQFDISRDGVDFSGYGGATTSGRWAGGSVSRKGTAYCAAATLGDGTRSTGNYVCSPNTSATVPVGYFNGTINLHACALGPCLDGLVPDPF
jgi:hypothetical protein